MFRILKKELLAPDIYRLDVEAPRVSRSALPGQFVIVRAGDKGERIPLTVADYDPGAGSVAIVIQAIGLSTRKIVELGEGDSLSDFAGPLGHPSELVGMPVEELRGMNILFVGGGVGTAPVYPQVKWLHERGVKADVIIGAKNADMHIMTSQMEAVAGNLYLATDDGSAGFKGMVTDLMEDLIVNQGKRYDLVISIGPMVMMKFVAAATRRHGIKTIVSLNTLMVDGTGMCGACRVSVGGKTRFTCIDGPEFDGHEVDFDEAMRRQTMYHKIERQAAERAQRDHKCRIGLDE